LGEKLAYPYCKAAMEDRDKQEAGKEAGKEAGADAAQNNRHFEIINANGPPFALFVYANRHDGMHRA
jgi:hypothetical protein